MDSSETSSSSSSSSSVPAPPLVPADHSQQETPGVSTAERTGSSAGRGAPAAVDAGTPTQSLSTEVDKRLQDPEVKKKLVEILRREVEELDCFWAKVEDHAIDTCGENASEAVVAAFKGVHTRRVANLNLEQTDSLCRDILLRLMKPDVLANPVSSEESARPSAFEEEATIL
ncbi:hypothetical protein CSUI_001785 [Cystoisospora suis]|uniref:Uncharacterized protein n=1 Tax=Cystoisospora suis TaxID=483139 RepID=A0A2C6LBP8_9APIC|nr:hypothetical protein CSUI_001785 [Cystoisospora suis]